MALIAAHHNAGVILVVTVALRIVSLFPHLGPLRRQLRVKQV